VKYRSVVVVLADMIWIQSFMHEFRISSPTPQLYCDNLSVVQLAANPILHSRSKHFELDLYEIIFLLRVSLSFTYHHRFKLQTF